MMLEGETMLPQVAPARHFNAAMFCYPGSEELRADEGQGILAGNE